MKISRFVWETSECIKLYLFVCWHQTAVRIITGQTVLKPASVRTGHSATHEMAAAAVCTAGSDCPAKKVQ